MLQGSGHPKAGRLSSLDVAGKGAEGGGGRRVPKRREVLAGWEDAAPSPPRGWRGGGQEAGLGQERPEGWGPRERTRAEGGAGESGRRRVIFLAPRPHSPSGLSFAPAGRRLRAASSLGLPGERAASGAPSNHARPHGPRYQPPAPLPPATHCARPQRTDGGPEGAIPAGGRQARGISGIVEFGRTGGHRARAHAIASTGVGLVEWNSGRCSLKVKSVKG